MRDGNKLPHWPAMMLRKTAAAYLDMAEAAFEREVAVGALPMPVRFGGKLHWHREQIDEYLAKLFGGGDWGASRSLSTEKLAKHDWRSESWIYNPDIPPPDMRRRRKPE